MRFQSKFYDRTPYTIMFGPDKCGNDMKVSTILCRFWFCLQFADRRGSYDNQCSQNALFYHIQKCLRPSKHQNHPSFHIVDCFLLISSVASFHISTQESTHRSFRGWFNDCFILFCWIFVIHNLFPCFCGKISVMSRSSKFFWFSVILVFSALYRYLFYLVSRQCWIGNYTR